ncbi:uncharacterized protein G2W53_039907 [Senna tora]|uniref:Uncharacterized protein n=1 Tax=Senna tora TaxID=362788 RepID=A0A834SQR6_9FABA|nr:uncharacterized protein G2W53_039907 [Senna tora]
MTFLAKRSQPKKSRSRPLRKSRAFGLQPFPYGSRILEAVRVLYFLLRGRDLNYMGHDKSAIIPTLSVLLLFVSLGIHWGCDLKPLVRDLSVIRPYIPLCSVVLFFGVNGSRPPVLSSPLTEARVR